MKRIAVICMILICIFGLAVPVSARSGADQLRCEVTVTQDGNCLVTISGAVTLEEPMPDLVFPIPAGALDVTLNGSAVGLNAGGRVQTVSLKGITGGLTGTHAMVITYRMTDVVTAKKDGTMLLELPLLCGYEYPIEDLIVKVTLPGEITGRPEIVSGYYQENSEQILDVSVSGPTVSIYSKQALKDHETLQMTLPVEPSMFPETAARARVVGLMDLAVLITLLLAVVYYLLALRPILPRKILRATGPDGLTAGHMGVWLTGGTMDLSLLVVAWAQMGYLRIEVEKSGRVLLHKRMEMGNERSAYENRVYKSLFGRRYTVDGTGDHYARMVRTVAKRGPQAREVYGAGSGNPYLFRGLCALAALLSGVSLGGGLAPGSVFLQILVALLIAVLAVLIQSGASCLALRNKLPLWIALGCAGLWLLLGIFSGEWLMAVLMLLVQVLAGFAAAYGGKRTVLGQQALAQILGLRKYLCTASKEDLQRLLNTNPGYFYELAPYALALGVDRTFARRFGKVRMPECTYLMLPVNSQMTAGQWAAVLRTTVDTLDAKAKRLPLDKLTGR